MSLFEDVAENKNIVILSHLNADPDAIGSSIAAYEYLISKGCDVKMSAAGGVNALARNLLKKLNYTIEINPSLEPYDAVLVLDTSSFSQLAPIKLGEYSGKIYVVDHHIPDEDLKGMVRNALFDESITSTSELVYTILKKSEFQFSREVCLALITGIVTDTAHLQFARPDTFRIVAELLDLSGMQYPDVLNFISIPTEPSRKIAHLKSASRLKMERLDGWIIALSHVSSFEASAARALVKIGADVAFVCSNEKGDARISIRANNTFTKKTKINFAKDYAPLLVDQLNGSGGGHLAAISVNGNFDGTENELLNQCYNLLVSVLEKKKSK